MHSLSGDTVCRSDTSAAPRAQRRALIRARHRHDARPHYPAQPQQSVPTRRAVDSPERGRTRESTTRVAVRGVRGRHALGGRRRLRGVSTYAVCRLTRRFDFPGKPTPGARMQQSTPRAVNSCRPWTGPPVACRLPGKPTRGVGPGPKSLDSVVVDSHRGEPTAQGVDTPNDRGDRRGWRPTRVATRRFGVTGSGVHIMV